MQFPKALAPMSTAQPAMIVLFKPDEIAAAVGWALEDDPVTDAEEPLSG